METKYDLIADEYYEDRHITSRNFDAATVFALKELELSLPQDGLVLELGAGRGRNNEFLGIEFSRNIQLDSSAKMLGLENREECLLRILADARKTPFLNDQFAICTAFLSDPFWDSDFTNEIFRILKSGGLFIATLPAYTWGINLRAFLGFKTNTTRFVAKNGEELEMPSYLTPKDDLFNQLTNSGFDRKSTLIKSCFLNSGSDKISPHIVISSNNQNKRENEIEIIDIVIARK